MRIESLAGWSTRSARLNGPRPSATSASVGTLPSRDSTCCCCCCWRVTVTPMLGLEGGPRGGGVAIEEGAGPWNHR